VFHSLDLMRIAMVSMGWPVLTAMYERAMSSISPG
jgi:hypothetical protein